LYVEVVEFAGKFAGPAAEHDADGLKVRLHGEARGAMQKGFSIGPQQLFWVTQARGLACRQKDTGAVR
jgi:hypothetical protein